jgi:UDP-N-acetylmuramoyl-L-alanyl-D-glutamate--2,6-diaminopimelate ligase
MKLKKLIKDIPLDQVKGSKEIEITGVCANSKLVAPGNLFIAKRGKLEDGTKYIPEAIAAGAKAVLTDIYDPSLKEITQLIQSDIKKVEGLIAAQYYENPSSELFVVGVTGTNGKTTTTFLVKHILDQLGISCGLIGTIEYIIGSHRYRATRTTPDVVSNQKMLKEMILHGCKAAVMEVSSHALDQGRVENIDYDVAIFTNLTLDHLDYHGTMENYCTSKNLLFSHLSGNSSKQKKKKLAVVNADSPWMKKIVQGCTAKVLTYGLNQAADLHATDIVLTASGTEFKLTYQNRSYLCRWSLVGRYNVYNYLAAVGACLHKNVPITDIIKALESFRTVAGRLEAVPNTLGLKIFVDFAHSDDALINVLECLNELKNGKIITVFGCGGDRDQEKRPKMAAAAEELSDFTIVTSDNPRSEKPEAIAADIAKGFKKKESFILELDRYRAIEKAIEMAKPEDIVLIAGKGHETYQIFAHKTIEFDDRKVALEVCKRLRG